jgi:sensor histidine kinase regulating citrate/malate metabolism
VNPDGLSFIDDLDIWSLFGNAIDNAIEAQEKEEEGKRLIRLNVNVKNSFTTIHVENYCTQKISFENGLPATSKNDKDFHGYGLKSISSIVEKYNGNALVRFKNHLFTLDIMIPIPEEAPLFKNTRESVSSDSI